MKMMIEVNIPEDRSVAEAVEALKQYFDPDWIASWWHISDIHIQANISEGIDCDAPVVITDEQAREVLRLMDKNHDAEAGFNWDVIDYYIDAVIKGQGDMA